MTTTPAPTDLDQVRARHEVALRWLREGYSYDDNFNQAALLIRDDVPALLDELAKTRARVATLDERVTTWKTRLVEETATLREELAKTQAELKRAEQRTRMASQHARNCDAQVADADAEVARLQSWLADERAKWLRHQAEDHPVDVLANPATTAEPADEPKATGCPSDLDVGPVMRFMCVREQGHPMPHFSRDREHEWTDDAEPAVG